MTAEGTDYIPIDERALNMVLDDDRPLKIINTLKIILEQ